MTSKTSFIDREVLNYIEMHSLRESALMSELRAETAKLSMARMQIPVEEGQFLSLLVKAIGVKRCLEIGTFTGYSALSMAMALPDDGRLVCCDISEEWTNIGRRYWHRAGVIHKIDLHIEPAVITLDKLLSKGEMGKFDFAFIDADKQSYDAYYECCLKLIRTGGLIVFDNTLWSGAVADESDQSEDTRALRKLNDKLHRDERVLISLLPLGDGITLALKC